MSDDYEKRLAAWKHAHGISHEDGSEITIEDVMRAEDAKSDEKDFCWRCAEEFPIKEMVIDLDPYIQDEERPERADGYIPSEYRVRTCKACAAKDENDDDEPEDSERKEEA